MSSRSVRLSHVGWAVAVTSLAVAAGIVPGVTSLAGTLAVAGAAVTALMIVAVRRGVAAGIRRTWDGRDPAAGEEDRSAGGSDLRTARVLFYLGCLLVAEPGFRKGLTLAEFMFLGALVLCVLSVLRGRAFPSIPTPMLLAVSIFVLGGSISSLDAQSPTGSVFQLLHAVYVLLLWPAVAAMVIRTRRQVYTALTLWTASAAVEGVAALAQLKGAHVFGLIPVSGRMTGFTPHPNDLGGATAIALVPALMLATRSATHAASHVTILRWLAVALIAIGVTLSGSITGMLGAGAAVLVWLSWPSARTGAPVAAAVMVICVIGAVAITHTGTSSPVQRLAQVASPTAETGGSLHDRLSLAEQAWPRISHDPFVGTGLDVADSALPIISHTYNTSYQLHGLPLAAWYQTGLFGLLGLLGLLYAVWRLGWRTIRHAASEPDLMFGLLLFAAFVAFVVETMSVPLVFQQYEWITVALLVGWNRLVLATSPAAPEQAPYRSIRHWRGEALARPS